MIYEGFYKAKPEPKRKYEITYCIEKDDGSYFIEAYINGGKSYSPVFIGSCDYSKAKKLVQYLAKKSVHPLHIEDIISDLNF